VSLDRRNCADHFLCCLRWNKTGCFHFWPWVLNCFVRFRVQQVDAKFVVLLQRLE
jgi:hypothetical protein